MKPATLYAVVGLLALAAGSGLWLAKRPAPGGEFQASQASIAPAALYSATFLDASGARQSLGRFQGKVVVLNFWATWCAPCREEMPAFSRLQSRWATRNVQFVGVSGEEPAAVRRFEREMQVAYPLWTGGDELSELSRRLGNPTGVLPHSAILGPSGHVLEVKVGPYKEAELESLLEKYTSKSS